jgi:hypothetical protein
MNSDFVLSSAAAIAKRVHSGKPERSLGDQISAVWQLLYQRSISAEELDWARAFASLQSDTLARTKAVGDRELFVLTNLAQQLLNSNEFLYVD